MEVKRNQDGVLYYSDKWGLLFSAQGFTCCLMDNQPSLYNIWQYFWNTL